MDEISTLVCRIRSIMTDKQQEYHSSSSSSFRNGKMKSPPAKDLISKIRRKSHKNWV